MCLAHHKASARAVHVHVHVHVEGGYLPREHRSRWPRVEGRDGSDTKPTHAAHADHADHTDHTRTHAHARTRTHARARTHTPSHTHTHARTRTAMKGDGDGLLAGDEKKGGYLAVEMQDEPEVGRDCGCRVGAGVGFRSSGGYPCCRDAGQTRGGIGLWLCLWGSG